MTLNDELPAWRRYLAYVTVAVMPIATNVEKIFHFKDKRFLSPLDFLIWPLLVVVVIEFRNSLRQPPAQRNFAWPPLAGLLWAGLALLSCAWIAHFGEGETFKTWGRGIQGAIVFGVLAVWVFQNLAPTPAEFRKMSLVLGVSVGLCLLLAVRQYVGPHGLPYDPDNAAQDLQGVSNIRLGGWYEFRGALGALVAIFAPAAAAFAVLDRDSAVRKIAFALAALSLFVTLSAGGFIGAVAGIVAVMGALAAARHWRAALAMLLFLVIAIGVMLPHLPRNNPQEIANGVALYVGEPGKKEAGARLRRYQAVVDLLSARTDPYNDKSVPYWVRGVGSGQYQHATNGFYTFPYDQPGARTDEEAQFGLGTHEPYTFGLFETVVVELGVFGLIAVLLLFAQWLAAASGAFTVFMSRGDHDEATLALAALGAGCGALVLSIFGNPAARGSGSVFAFFFALALCAQTWASRPANPQSEAKAETPAA